jgi:hypothetical protein
MASVDGTRACSGMSSDASVRVLSRLGTSCSRRCTRLLDRWRVHACLGEWLVWHGERDQRGQVVMSGKVSDIGLGMGLS